MPALTGLTAVMGWALRTRLDYNWGRLSLRPRLWNPIFCCWTWKHGNQTLFCNCWHVASGITCFHSLRRWGKRGQLCNNWRIIHQMISLLTLIFPILQAPRLIRFQEQKRQIPKDKVSFPNHQVWTKMVLCGKAFGWKVLLGKKLSDMFMDGMTAEQAA